MTDKITNKQLETIIWDLEDDSVDVPRLQTIITELIAARAQLETVALADDVEKCAIPKAEGEGLRELERENRRLKDRLKGRKIVLRQDKSNFEKRLKNLQRVFDQRVDKLQARAEAAEVRVRELEVKLEVERGMYDKVVSVALDCDPVPACEREDDKLEPPWEVFRRVKSERDEAMARLEEAEGVVSFYADPESYFAVLIMGDRPCGDFADDIDDNHSRPDMGPRPGKLAREYICKYYTPAKGDQDE